MKEGESALLPYFKFQSDSINTKGHRLSAVYRVIL